MKSHKHLTEADAEAFASRPRPWDQLAFGPGITRIESLPKEATAEAQHQQWHDTREAFSDAARGDGMRRAYPGAE